MTRRHSLVTRALALVLALVMVASNGAGLTLGAKAAELETKTELLFDLMQANRASNKKLDEVLKYAGAMSELAGMNKEVTYYVAPEAAEGQLRSGTLTVENIENWKPYAAYIGNSTTLTYFEEGKNTIEGLKEDVLSANVVYAQDLGVAADIAKVHTWIPELAADIAVQKDTLQPFLDDLVTIKAMSEDVVDDLLSILENDIDAVALGFLSEEPADQNGDGIVTDEEYLHYQENQEAIDADRAAVEADVARVVSDYKTIVEGLRGRLVPGEAHTDRLLVIYGMMRSVKDQGLPYYYAHADEIIKEMAAVRDVLNDVLCENVPAEDKEYYEKAMIYMLDNSTVGDYATPDDMKELRDMMVDGVNDLGGLPTTFPAIDNLAWFETAEAQEKGCTLAGLYDALAACSTITGVKDSIVLLSGKLEIRDTTWTYIETTINGTPASYPVLTGEALTEEDIDNASKYFKSMEPHYDVVVDTTGKLVAGTVVTEDITVECTATPKEYTINVTKGEEVVDTIKVMGNDETITLPFLYNHEYVYAINGGAEFEVKNAEAAVIEITAEDMNLIAAENYVVEQVSHIDLGQEGWDSLLDELNTEYGREAFTQEGDTITALISMDEMETFADVLGDLDKLPVKLGGVSFLYANENDDVVINAQALIDALLHDPSFTSEKLIALGQNGSGNLLNSTMEMFESEKKFILNLTEVPDEMVDVADGLDEIKEYMWFDTNNGSGELNVSADLPEGVYEVYLTAALLAGEMSDNDVASLNNEVTLNFVKDYFLLLMDMDADVYTLENTFAAAGEDVDLADFEDYYDMMRDLANSDGFSDPVVSGNTVTFYAYGTADDVDYVLDLVGIDLEEMTGSIVEVDPNGAEISATLTVVNEPPKFEALVIDPDRLDDSKLEDQVLAFNYYKDLTRAEFKGSSAIMLLGDVDGDLVFDQETVLDLNGFTVNGSITANAPLYIGDSSVDTISGAGVTGSITGDVTILAGSYPNANVEGFLREGYHMEGTNVVNELYVVKNGDIIIDGSLYLIENTEDYEEAAWTVAADIVADTLLNYYYAAAMDVNGNRIYNITFNDLVTILEDVDWGAVADQALTCIDADGLSALCNDVLAALFDFATVRDAVANGTALGSYTVTAYGWDISFYHDEAANRITADILASNRTTSNTMKLYIDIPDGENKDLIIDALDVLAECVVDSNIEITLDQPVRDGDNLILGVTGTADVTMDFSHDQEYNEMLAGVIAYFNDEVDALLDSENMCIIPLNEAMAKVTVGDFFTAVQDALDDPEITFADIAEELEIKLTDAELAKMEELYKDFKKVCTEFIEDYDLLTDSSKPLAELDDGTGTVTFEGELKNETAEVYYEEYGLIVNLHSFKATLTVKLAAECTEILGDANRDEKVSLADLVLIRQYLIGKKTAEDLHMCVCDLDGDGEVRLADLVLLRQFLINKIPKFPVEK